MGRIVDSRGDCNKGSAFDVALVELDTSEKRSDSVHYRQRKRRVPIHRVVVFGQ